MLVVEVDALRVVDLLHVLDERVHRGLDVGQLAQVAEVDEALGDLVTGADLAAILDAGHELNGGGDALLVQDAARVVRVGEREHVLGLLGLNGEVTGERGQIGLATEDLLVDVADDIEHAGNGRETRGVVRNASDAPGVYR